MALTLDERKVAAEMLRTRLAGLQGDLLVQAAMRFREAGEDGLRLEVRAFAQERLSQIETALANQQAAIAEAEAQKVVYEAALQSSGGSAS